MCVRNGINHRRTAKWSFRSRAAKNNGQGDLRGSEDKAVASDMIAAWPILKVKL